MHFYANFKSVTDQNERRLAMQGKFIEADVMDARSYLIDPTAQLDHQEARELLRSFLRHKGFVISREDEIECVLAAKDPEVFRASLERAAFPAA